MRYEWKQINLRAPEGTLMEGAKGWHALVVPGSLVIKISIRLPAVLPYGVEGNKKETKGLERKLQEERWYG